METVTNNNTTLTIFKYGDRSEIDISTLLNEDDHEKWWNGIEEEKQDGSDCIISENVQKIMDAVEKYSTYTIEIWEVGNASVKDIDEQKIDDIVKELESIFDVKFEIAEG